MSIFKNPFSAVDSKNTYLYSIVSLTHLMVWCDDKFLCCPLSWNAEFIKTSTSFSANTFFFFFFWKDTYSLDTDLELVQWFLLCRTRDPAGFHWSQQLQKWVTCGTAGERNKTRWFDWNPAVLWTWRTKTENQWIHS